VYLDTHQSFIYKTTTHKISATLGLYIGFKTIIN